MFAIRRQQAQTRLLTACQRFQLRELDRELRAEVKEVANPRHPPKANCRGFGTEIALGPDFWNSQLQQRKLSPMPRYSLETIIVILLILWLLGAFISPFGGSLIHLILVIVLVVVVIRLLQGRNALP